MCGLLTLQLGNAPGSWRKPPKKGERRGRRESQNSTVVWECQSTADSVIVTRFLSIKRVRCEDHKKEVGATNRLGSVTRIFLYGSVFFLPFADGLLPPYVVIFSNSFDLKRGPISLSSFPLSSDFFVDCPNLTDEMADSAKESQWRTPSVL